MLPRIATALTDLLFPTKCRACGILFRPSERTLSRIEDETKFEGAMASFLCPACRGEFLPVAPPLCPACGEPFISRQGADHLCGACIESPRRFKKARAVGIYEGGLLKAVHCLKYRGRIELARPLGSLLFSGFLKHWSPGDIHHVIPVPLHIRRMRRRGFNQSLLLVQGWPKRLRAAGREFRGVTISPHLLARPRPTASQTGLGKRLRKKNLRGAFTVPAPGPVKGSRVLLVDDVYTTGATADACAEALRNAGAQQVDVLTLARTPGK